MMSEYINWREQYMKGLTVENLEDGVLKNLIVLRGMVEAYPQEAFDLHAFKQEGGPCGTIYCTVGLAACQPFFIQKGLSMGKDGFICMHGESIAHTEQDAVDEIFGENSFENLFQRRGEGSMDDQHAAFELTEDEDFGEVWSINKSVSDKELALWRLDRAIEELKGKQE